MNLLTHTRKKTGVIVDLTISTDQPLPFDVYSRLNALTMMIDQLFDAIPEPEAVAS